MPATDYVPYRVPWRSTRDTSPTTAGEGTSQRLQGLACRELSADHFQGLKKIMRTVLWAANAAHTVAGTSVMYAVCRLAHKMGFPLWTTSMPRPHNVKIKDSVSATDRKVVYFPSSINQAWSCQRSSGQYPAYRENDRTAAKSGYEVISPTTWTNSVVAPYGKARECPILPTPKQPN